MTDRLDTGTCTAAEPFVLRVVDDSMEPEFRRGCIIIIDPTGVARDGAFVFADYGGEFVFRRLSVKEGRHRLVALNDAYPAVELESGLQAVKGIVVQRAGARRSYHKRYG